MKIAIRNVRGIDAGEVELAHIALLAGANGAGKSSVATALSACLMRTPAPLPGMTKTAARDLLRDTAQRGKASLSDGEAETTVNWPGGSVSGEGPQASPIACGVVSVADMSPKQRAAFLIDALQAMPSREELVAALEPQGVSGQTVQAVWQAIEDNGWDAAHKRAQESGARAKGAWEQITGEAYGAKKAEEWKPQPLEEHSEPPSAETIEAEISDRRRHLEDVISRQAVSSAEVERLQQAAGYLEGWQQEVERIGGELKNAQQAGLEDDSQARAEADASARAVEELPKPGQLEQTAPCPSCGTHLVVVSRSELRTPAEGGPSEEENARRQDAIDAARAEAQRLAGVVSGIQAKHREHQQLVADLQRQLDHAQGQVNTCQQAAEQLQGLDTSGTTDADVQAARDAIDAAEHRLAVLNQWHDAASKHSAIQRNQVIIDTLAPTGLRQAVLAQRLSSINDRLSSIASTSGWAPVEIADDLSVIVSGRDYSLLSGGEQFRCRVSLQLAFSAIDGSSAVVVDAADILDKPGRNGLFKALKAAGIPALVTMTWIADRGDVPDLSRAGMGASYWAEDAAITRLSP